MNDKPKLTLVKGGESKGKRGGKVAPGGLTEKQETFVQGLAEGLTNAEAYRRAYDAEGMTANSVYNESCKLAQNPKISQRLNALLEEKRAKHHILTEKQSDRVWRNVWRLAEGSDVPPAVQQSAIALAAKMAGMLTDKVEVKNELVDSKSIEAELLQRLQKLTA